MVDEIYTKRQVLELFKKLLERYGNLEIKFYWWNSYVGECYSKIDVKEAENGYEVVFYSEVC